MAFASDLWRMWRVAGIFVVVVLASRYAQEHLLTAGTEFYEALALRASPVLALQTIIVWSRWIDASRTSRIWATATIAFCAGLYALAAINASLESRNQTLFDSVFWAASLISIAVTYWLIYRSARLSTPPPHLDESTAFAEGIAALADPMPAKLAENLMRESERMRRISFVTLGGVAALMSVTVLVVLFAGVITSLDLTGANPLLKAESYASSARNALAGAESELKKLLKQERDLKQELDVASLPDDMTTRSEKGGSYTVDSNHIGLKVRLVDVEIADLLNSADPEATFAVKAARKAAMRELADIRKRIIQMENEAAARELSGLKSRVESAAVDEEFRRIKKALKPLKISELSEELNQVRASIERQRSEIPFLAQTNAAALELLDTVRKEDVLGESSTALATAQSSEALIASAVTRFGVIAVLMFLAQALINLYRYALRLSAFYRSRALMVVLTGGDLVKMEAASKTLSADHVSLGREPKSPIEDAKRLAEIAKDLRA